MRIASWGAFNNSLCGLCLRVWDKEWHGKIVQDLGYPEDEFDWLVWMLSDYVACFFCDVRWRIRKTWTYINLVVRG